MKGKKELNEIRSRLDVLLDNIRESMSDIDEYTSEIRRLLVESGERI